jgi:hypothetical protein
VTDVVFWQILAAIRRRPLITVVGLALTALLAAYVHGRPGLYFTEVNAIFLNPAPQTARGSAALDDAAPAPVNPLDGTNPDLISTAGVVARVLAQGASKSLSGSDSISLVGTGLTHGYTVTLPNSGGQWVYQFDRPVLDVQVVGRNPAEVQALLDTAMARIRSTLQAQEMQTGTTKDQMIRVFQNPQRPVIGEGLGDRRRATAVALMLGIMLTLTALHLLQDRVGPIRRAVRYLRRRSGRRRDGDPVPPPAPRPVRPVRPIQSAGRSHSGAR